MSTSVRLPRPDEMAQGKETEYFIRIALHELNDEQRQLIVLRDIENLTYEDIQKLTGLPAGNREKPPPPSTFGSSPSGSSSYKLEARRKANDLRMRP